jgi:hypothetical protein|nr:MAG TPA: protein of unknown function (DUF5016) [Caudoviricetes sp.]
MKKHLFYLLLLGIPLILTSCEFDENGDVRLSNLGWIIVIGAVIIFIIAIIGTSKQSSESKARMKKVGMDYSQFVPMGTYAGGHPNIDKTVENVYIRNENKTLAFYTIQFFEVSMPEAVPDASIPCEDITDITIEDATSIEKKITVGRIFLVGIFALGWRKKKKNELAFLVIEWKKGKFEHSTTFSFEGKDAFQKANTARNQLIKFCE